MPEDRRPLCPLCGEPAREVLGLIQAYIELDNTGEPTGKSRVLPGAPMKDLKYYRCGGRHLWPIPITEKES